MREGEKMVNYTSVLVNVSGNDDFGNKDSTSYPKAIVIINCVLNASLMLIAIIRNSLVLAAILRTPSLRSPPTFSYTISQFQTFLFG